MGKKIDKELSLDEIYMELCNYKAMGIDAYYIFNGTRLDSTMNFDELRDEIQRLILGMSKEEYNRRKYNRITPEELASIILEKKKFTCSSTKFFINSVSKLIPQELKDSFEIDCYMGLMNGLSENVIKRISILLIFLYENKNEKELISVFRNSFFLIDNNYDMSQIITFLKKYGTNHEFLEKCIYSNIDIDDEKKDYERFYAYLKRK